MKRELEAEMTVNEGGKTLRITVFQALVKTLKHRALQGDPTMMRMLLRLADGIKPDDPVFETLPEDETVLKDLLDQMEPKSHE